MGVTISGDKELLARLKRAGADLLAEIAPEVSNEAARVIVSANGAVPRESGELAGSSFVDGPVENHERLSVTATCGYESPHAPFVHEGFHFGRKVKAPSKWLERAADGVETGFAARMKSAILAGLNRLVE